MKSAVQVVVFLALLFYLLAAKYDPVAAVLEMVPLPPDARLRISSSVERSMRGILLCTAKLAFFHAMFTWLTFRWFEVHLVYLSCLASAVSSFARLLPPFCSQHSQALIHQGSEILVSHCSPLSYMHIYVAFGTDQESSSSKGQHAVLEIDTLSAYASTFAI